MSEGVSYSFRCRGSFSGEAPKVVRFTGTEGISRLYRFVVELRWEDPDVDPAEVLDKPWTLEMNVGGEQRVVHGLAMGFEELGQAGPDALYRVVLVPRLWRATRNPTSGAYLDQTVEEIIREVLEGDAGLTTEDYELDLQTDYRKWDYRCQFGETPFRFLARLMEREGIYFFFEHPPDGKHEKLVVTDHRGRQPEAPEEPLTYAPDRGQEVDGFGRLLRAFVSRHDHVPGQVVVQDHNPDQPAADPQGEGEVEGGGGQVVYEYGDSILDPEEGERLGRVRTEELQCRRRRFFGEGSAVGLLAGARFALEGHFRERFNREFLVTELEHSGHEPSLLVADSEPAGEPPYACSLTALPGDVQFRPERSHDKPRFHGSMTARVESEESSEKYAFIDDQGRYKIRLPFDRKGGDRPSGKASHWVRTATPYGGKEEGLHFRLRPNTEVLLTFLEGDPDRPVISGVSSNRDQSASLLESDRTKHWLQTPGGVGIRLTDSEEEKGMDTLLWASWQTQVGDSGKFTSDINTQAYSPDGRTSDPTRPPNTDPFLPRNHKGGLQDDQKSDPWSPQDYTESPAQFEAQDGGGAKVRYRFVRRNADEYHFQVGDSFTWGDGDNESRDFLFGRQYQISVASEGNHEKAAPTEYLIDTLAGQSVKSGGIVDKRNLGTDADWAEVKKLANVNLGAYDQINYVEGSVYDFGGYWEYAMGNGYEEALLARDGSGEWPLNADWLGKAGTEMPAFQSTIGPGNDVNGKFLNLDGGKTLVSRTVDPSEAGGVFDYTQADVIEVHRGKSEEHRQGSSYELAYDGGGTLRSQAWKEGTDYEEQKWDPNGVAYHFKKGYCWGGMDDWFEWSNMASMSLNMSLSSMSSTNIYAANSNTLNVFAGAESEITVKASAGFSLTANAAVNLDLNFNAAANINIFVASLDVALDLINMQIGVEGPGVEIDTEAITGGVYLKAPGLELNSNMFERSIKVLGVNIEMPSAMEIKV
ncbi:type VI secretion system Vgr family protein [Thiohalorhabdus sp. Cl-TMA]|uniref:Type VI secretion system Vgr family protein n=1 Tax=Thiohalorhabdus methylotrophus TaxID=3242694 RepID=A0ABV4TSN1_9GAMM